MLNKKVALPILAAVLMALGVNLEKFGIDLEALTGTGDSSSQSQTNRQTSSSNTSSVQGQPAAYRSGSKWSNTSPEINLHHIFEGEINKRNKPVGYHSRPGGVDADGAKIVRIRDKPNSVGVYTATIAVRDGNQWKEKFSSFFPDSMSVNDVTEAVLSAYKNSSKEGPKWQGPSGHGFDIQGYTTNRGGINTAFPVYRR